MITHMRINWKKFDWFNVLEPLANGATIDLDDQETLTIKAHEWPTCACGQLCKALPRDMRKAPHDGLLRSLGTRFYHRVLASDWVGALQVFNKIEARSAMLLGIPLVERKPVVATGKPFAVTMGHALVLRKEVTVTQ